MYEYNNEQVWKVFRQNFSSNMPKNGLFLVVNSQKLPNAGGSAPESLASGGPLTLV